MKTRGRGNRLKRFRENIVGRYIFITFSSDVILHSHAENTPGRGLHVIQTLSGARDFRRNGCSRRHRTRARTCDPTETLRHPRENSYRAVFALEFNASMTFCRATVRIVIKCDIPGKRVRCYSNTA